MKLRNGFNCSKTEYGRNKVCRNQCVKSHTRCEISTRLILNLSKNFKLKVTFRETYCPYIKPKNETTNAAFLYYPSVFMHR